MPKLYLILGWLLSTIAAVVVGSLSVYALIVGQKEPIVLDSLYEPMVASSEVAYTPPVGEVKGIETTVAGEDARAELVANFLERHDSPLKPYDEFGRKLVEIADRHGIDFRFLPAIAMQESNLCKRIPPGSYNCLGFGIHERGTLMFDSYDANFERAARELKANYIDQGLDTPEKIMKKYTPSSNGSWAESVKQWMAEMRYDDRQKGRELKRNSSVLEFAGEPVTETTHLE